ncbi:MAG TPA: NAD(P)/FAD-dependent oxidoreductase [Bauldia sp.]|nr:NAD(P)/FAD-dependent oxidoreductase [Bauldia sp.]
MQRPDVAIVGGGLAGSLAAAALGRAGIEAILIDPHAEYPRDLRCEKFDPEQVAILQRTGIADAILPAMGRADELRVARFGHVLDQKPGRQYGMLYHDIVNTVRRAIPPRIPRALAKVTAIETSADRQTVTLATGEKISARLVVLAIGLNPGLRHTLGLEKKELSHAHSITAGFDVKPVGRANFEFPALTYYPERASDKGAYLTLFPTPSAMRANYMCYRGLDDPWILRLRKDPYGALTEVMPHLEKAIGKFEVAGEMRIRPADLYITEGYEQPGIVLIGDAFSTSCPAAGTGAGKAINDVAQLCNVHIPAWLASDGMDAGKIATFYADAVKQDYDRRSIERAYALRAVSTDPSLRYAAKRWIAFLGRAGIGIARRLGDRVRPRSAGETPKVSHV